MTDTSSYSIIAPYYDWIMEHVDYQYWADYIKKIFDRFSFYPHSILELGAGTCPFLKTGLYTPSDLVVLSDISLKMLLHAGNGQKHHKVATNMCIIPFQTLCFDLCLLVYDAFNYALTEDEALHCLGEVHRILNHGGVFIFDITMEQNSIQFFYDTVDYEEREDCAVTRQSWYDEKKRIQHNNFIYFMKQADGRYIRQEEYHLQRIYLLSEMQELINKTGFIMDGCFNDFTFDQAGEYSERVHFVLRK
ncbi:MAG: class I SAM-dependent methyltransferase [Fibrobacteria bacterium]|nr:class I SAM-dependent methyltransferase [Fibrobacteria bacterium]